MWVEELGGSGLLPAALNRTELRLGERGAGGSSCAASAAVLMLTGKLPVKASEQHGAVDDLHLLQLSSFSPIPPPLREQDFFVTDEK